MGFWKGRGILSDRSVDGVAKLGRSGTDEYSAGINKVVFSAFNPERCLRAVGVSFVPLEKGKIQRSGQNPLFLKSKQCQKVSPETLA